jgi:hypothetical protein
MVLGSSATASIAVIRPLIPAGPILRGFQFENCFNAAFCAIADWIPGTHNKRIHDKKFLQAAIIRCFGNREIRYFSKKLKMKNSEGLAGIWHQIFHPDKLGRFQCHLIFNNGLGKKSLI